jgi:HlyD family secretion protein
MKKIKWLIWILVIAAAGVGVWFWKFKEEKTTLVLNTEKPQFGTISTSITATGTVQPVDTVSVGSQVSGTINKVYVDFNSTVKKGQLLAQLDKSLMLAQVQQINANLQQAKANLTYQQSNFQRQDHLFQVGAISKAEQETAMYQYNTAKDNVNSVAAQLSSANRNLSFTDIYSPIDGTVLSRSVSEGQTVAASFSTPTLFSIAKDLTKMQVRASVDEADIGNVGKGQRVSFTVDAFPDDTFFGIVKDIRLQPSTSANVVTYTTIVDAPNADLKLKPGMTASIIIYTKEIQNTLLVPNSAFQFKPDSAIKKIYTVQGRSGDKKDNEAKGSSRLAAPPTSGDSGTAVVGKPAVLWIKQDTSLVLRHVITGLDNGIERQVLSGLTANDEVVTGYQQLTKEQKKSTATSPFMPARRQNNRGGSGGGARPQR